jgi:hypothetical protein
MYYRLICHVAVCAAGAKSAAASHVMEVEEVEDFTNDFEVRALNTNSISIIATQVGVIRTLHCSHCSRIWLIMRVW